MGKHCVAVIECVYAVYKGCLGRIEDSEGSHSTGDAVYQCGFTVSSTTGPGRKRERERWRGERERERGREGEREKERAYQYE